MLPATLKAVWITFQTVDTIGAIKLNTEEKTLCNTDSTPLIKSITVEITVPATLKAVLIILHTVGKYGAKKLNTDCTPLHNTCRTGTIIPTT